MRRTGDGNDNFWPSANTTPARQLNDLDIRQIATPLDSRQQHTNLSPFPVLGTPDEATTVTFSEHCVGDENEDMDDGELFDSSDFADTDDDEEDDQPAILAPIINQPIDNAEPSPEELERERRELADNINHIHSNMLHTQKVSFANMFQDMCLGPFLVEENVEHTNQMDPMTGDMPVKIETRYDEYALLFCQCQRDMLRLGMFHSEFYAVQREKLCDLISFIYYAFNAIANCLSATSISLGFYKGNPMQSTLYKNDWKEVDPGAKYARDTRMSLFYFLTETACKNGLKKYGNDLYRQIYWTGHYTL